MVLPELRIVIIKNFGMNTLAVLLVQYTIHALLESYICKLDKSHTMQQSSTLSRRLDIWPCPPFGQKTGLPICSAFTGWCKLSQNESQTALQGRVRELQKRLIWAEFPLYSAQMVTQAFVRIRRTLLSVRSMTYHGLRVVERGLTDPIYTHVPTRNFSADLFQQRWDFVYRYIASRQKLCRAAEELEPVETAPTPERFVRRIQGPLFKRHENLLLHNIRISRLNHLLPELAT